MSSADEFRYQNDPCIFCEIAAHRARACVVHEDGAAMALMDIRPINPGHVLVIPKQHAVLLEDLPADTAGHLFRLVQRVGSALRRQSEFRCEGFDVFLADGEVAGQAIFHVHIHLLPRFAGDGFVIQSRERRVHALGELRPAAAALVEALSEDFAA